MSSETPQAPHGLSPMIVPSQADAKLPFGRETRTIAIDGKEIPISAEMHDILLCDAQERGITIQQAYNEELAARRELERITPSVEVLARMIERSGAPQYLASEAPSERPF